MMLMGSVVKGIREKFNPTNVDKEELVRFLGGLVTQSKDSVANNELYQKISARELAYRLRLLDQELQIENRARPKNPNVMLKAFALARTSLALSNVAGHFQESFGSAMADEGFGSRALQ